MSSDTQLEFKREKCRLLQSPALKYLNCVHTCNFLPPAHPQMLVTINVFRVTEAIALKHNFIVSKISTTGIQNSHHGSNWNSLLNEHVKSEVLKIWIWETCVHLKKQIVWLHSSQNCLVPVFCTDIFSQHIYIMSAYLQAKYPSVIFWFGMAKVEYLVYLEHRYDSNVFMNGWNKNLDIFWID